MLWRPYQRDHSSASRAYRARLLAAIVLSALIHAGAVAAYWNYRPAPGPLLPEVDEPLVINLMPEAPPTPSAGRQFIDAVVPTELPPEPTPRIAEVDQRASDESPADEGDSAPNVDEGRVEQAGSMPISAPPVAPAPEPTPEAEANEQPAEVEEEEVAEEEPILVAANTPPAPRASVEAMATPPAPQTPPRPAQEAAPAPPQPSSPVERPAPTQSPVHGEATNLGFLGFEAIQDDLAPYMKIVRNAVEKRWLIAIHRKYNGTDPVDAVLECAIAPNGEIMSVEIAEPGESLRFAILCKEAVEQAGPFPPFPFEVPAMYRNEHLRIRWTFSFL